MSPEVLAAIGGVVVVTFGGLVGIIYSNVKAEIGRVRDTCTAREEQSEEWRTGDNKFKVDVVDRLARLETMIRENGRDAL